MSGSARLVQRFLDQELSAEERVELLVRLGWDASLREQLIELERLMADVSRLPRPTVPEGFVARVLEATGPAATPNWRQRVATLLWTPRVAHWNVAAAAASVVLVIGAAIGAARVIPSAPLPGDEAAASATAEPPASVLVRLVVLRPGATSVEAAGDFNGWTPARTPLTPTGDGAWTVTIALEPGRYEYMFVVDGREWIADPFATEQRDDGFGSRNAVLDVRHPTQSS